MSDPVLEAESLTRRFWDGDREILVLEDVSFRVGIGETLAVTGSSGSGKSTLLHLLGGLDRPSAGTVRVGGQDLFALGEAERGTLRNWELGFVYQFHHLMPEFDALENVMMPLLIRRQGRAEAQEAAEEMLARVGLAERLRHKPSELSGGERQRTAIARALVTRPSLILADEPTGNLDDRTAERIHDLLLSLNRELGTALVVVTHDAGLAGLMGQQFRLLEGHLEAG
ncbi:lipoprotein ABC transporter ATP-binding protein [Thiohalorhabdus denitrificans]|uniref:Lipoprotein-releasing system ATP-binding protein LolD n=1 Tax=Thiohalorhabdus denitrificans TaxID=381306 RepID=A0A0P9CXK8_9GAMM|nr:lipoprotein-releasing ABC transporter ATP-binding protein LolD [Thiohalorhabdus denitrificans]KPV41602.1 lipoprotein ABC transporter ATP-binding protein [Thiohalorhabdus denitrificans]SCY57634.1 lipoprotein-releasing system ATP-binding protein [Thiohalorhabdus denitrificans]